MDVASLPRRCGVAPVDATAVAVYAAAGAVFLEGGVPVERGGASDYGFEERSEEAGYWAQTIFHGIYVGTARISSTLSSGLGRSIREELTRLGRRMRISRARGEQGFGGAWLRTWWTR